MKAASLLIFAFCTLCSFQCSKDKHPEEVLPSATQEGKNTIGFTIDDQVWRPYSKCGFGADPCGQLSAQYGEPSAAPDAISFQFARKLNNSSSSLTISSAFTGTITTRGDKTDSITATYRADNASGNNGYYEGPVTGSRFFVSRVDSRARVIAGEFELILIEQNGSGNTIRLRDGRFDFRFNACICSN